MTDTPTAPLLAFYADDFTGATDVLDALGRAGVRTRLLFRAEADTDADADTDTGADSPDRVEVIGIAGMSRTMSVAQMDAALPAMFRALSQYGAPVIHYKVCSTFDSSATVGSIGHAAELGSAQLQATRVPVIVGVPALGRYTAFGHLFARAAGRSHPVRIDRHPVMSRHPSTPMTEADLGVHLRTQTTLPIGLVDCAQVEAAGDTLTVAPLTGRHLMLIDVASEAALAPIGRWLWETALQEPQFVVGSSGVEYALLREWDRRGLLTPPDWPDAEPASPILVVSGSCSPTTENQIQAAVAAGFAPIRLDARAVTGTATQELWPAEAAAAIDALDAGRSVCVHLGGAGDGYVHQVDRTLHASFQRELGAELGSFARRVVERAAVRRLVVCGGDTSGAVAHAFELQSAQMLVPTSPGAPTCRTRSAVPSLDGLEIAFKGGQMGQQDYILRVARGQSLTNDPRS